MSASPGSRNVVLFLPPYKGKILGPPLGLLSLAGALREAGYLPRIVDGALDRDYRATVAREIEDALCFGVSLLTGPMILDAIEIARMVKSVRPELPVIFGGWHPSLLTDQTLREQFVDIVVRHQGERTLVEILDRLEAGKPLDLVAGCWFKRGGAIVRNPDRPAEKLPDLPRPAYDLIDFDAYQSAGGKRTLPYATSIGCPYACNYCTDMVFYNRRFNAYRADETAAELAALVSRYRLSDVSLLDSNFLVDIRRAVAIAQGILDSGVRFRWSFQASTDFVCRMTDAQVELLGASGVSHIGFGTETAAPEILARMEKHHQTVPDMFEAARKCARAGIRVTFNLIFGYPGEQESHRRETMRVMSELAARFENATFSPNLFTPYPGIPIWPQLRELGLAEPQSLAEWARIDLGANNLPWLQGASFEQLDRGIRYFLLDNEIHRAQARVRSRPLRWLAGLLRKPLHWRLRRARFDWPLELRLANARKRLTVRRSLLTGQPLSGELARIH